MPTSRRFASSFLLLMMLAAALPAALANGLGMPVPVRPAIMAAQGPVTEQLISDQRAGSVLFYPIYSSNPTDPITENTRINITNINPISSVTVHLTFVDGVSCTPADATLCLTPSQTMSITANDFDPGTMGWIVAVAINSDGCPINYNWLIGDVFVKLNGGYSANLAAESVPAIAGTDRSPMGGCTAADFIATLSFDGLQYARLPQTLAIDNIPSAVDGNSTLVVVINPTGDLRLSANRVGNLFGLMFNDAEIPSSYVMTSDRCQLKEVLSNTFPRTVPRFRTLIPAGRSGWLKLAAVDGRALLGVVINANPLAGVLSSAFTQGHNMHILSLAPTASLVIPVLSPGC